MAVALTGTDLYQDLPLSLEARTSLEYGDRLILLQPVAVDALPPQVRSKARVIFQSASPAHPTPAEPGTFQVCVLAHLRDVKDPFLAARAARLLPERSRLRIVHLGAALDVHGEAEARTEMASNARYRWVGERRRNEALSILAGSRLLLVTSRLEGGANVVSEAIASTVPVLSTRIDGSLGILGSNYLGYFPVGDAGALAGLLQRAEEEKGFMASLLEGVARVRPLVEPVREREAWRALLGELVH